MKQDQNFSEREFDPSNPDPWLALYLDQSLPMDDSVKQALLNGHNSNSRQFLLPFIRPLARTTIVLVQILRVIIPDSWNSSHLLHKTIYWGLKYFVSRDANKLILRHFNIGTELLQFIADNVGVTITTTKPLRPARLEDLLDDVFRVHDLNVYNFITELSQKLRREELELVAANDIDFSAISDNIETDPGDDCRFAILDLQTAIELYTPLYALFLSDSDFWRASNSLQLDETVAIYISKLLNDPLPLSLVNNRHPTVPITTLQAGYRLMLHGLDAELLYGYLQKMKCRQTRESA